MLIAPRLPTAKVQGFSLIEVLLAILILSVGVLGIAGLQARAQQLEIESYQRATALTLAHDMLSRIELNRKQVTSYVAATEDGVGVKVAPVGVNCASPADQAAIDVCEWDQLLEGAAVKEGAISLGAMPSAQGCVTEDATVVPAQYRVEVVWGGTSAGSAPAADVACGADLIHRRAVVLTTTIADLDG